MVKSMTETELVSKDMNIGHVVQKYPKLVNVFLQHGLMCVGYHAAQFENIEQGAKAHGIDVDRLMADLNKNVAE